MRERKHRVRAAEEVERPSHREGEGLSARQRRQHILSLYVSACDYARQLEGALLEGRSPTGYGSPLTPLDVETAEAILERVREYLRKLRDFVEELAPRELEAHERPQPQANTLVWASNLLERLRQIGEELTPRRLSRYGDLPCEAERFTAVRDELLALLEEAREAGGLPRGAGSPTAGGPGRAVSWPEGPSVKPRRPSGG
ncbi:MAG: hypothetical protein N2512_14340 [Armatimonadetes bacterium]|nr:hypothetical protein [Armatimonadota bacterium]